MNSSDRSGHYVLRKKLLSVAILSIACQGAAWAQSTSTDGPSSTSASSSTTKPAKKSTASTSQLDAVVVTGSRTETTVGKSSTPVQVISGATLQATGQPSLRDALVTMSPGISNMQYAGDNAEFTDVLQLDGLSPDHVLVLVNGKRRHGTANMVQDSGLDQGSTGVDIDMIPTGLIDHIEVLRDGAAAQYGSDAIAGVINIILKDDATGGEVSSTSGQTYQGDGFKNSESASIGMTLGQSGFLDLSAEYDRQNHAYRNGPYYATNAWVYGGAVPTPVGPAYDNRWESDTASTRKVVGFNVGYDFNDDIEAYAFGTFGHRKGESFENIRPDIAVNGYSGATLPGYSASTGASFPSYQGIYPNGFTPLFQLREDDYSFTGGVKDSNLFGWTSDLSVTYGADHDWFNVFDSANEAYAEDFGGTPTSFTYGALANSQLTGNLDLSHPFQLGFLAQPLNFAFGFEERRETYQIMPGDYASWYGGGAAGEAGFTPQNAGAWSRNVFGTYIDLSSHITDQWQADLAARYEHYSDAGNTTNEKISTRYDFTPQVALRASASTGFHAPSLAEEYSSLLSVSPPEYASGTLAPNSTAAESIGAKPLKPEKATNLNVGLVLNPLTNWNITADAYQIDIRNRIVQGGSTYGCAAVTALQAMGIDTDSFLASGVTPENCSSQPAADQPTGVSASYFTNGANTRTRGLDISSIYRVDYPGFGHVDWDFKANFTTSRVTQVAKASSPTTYTVVNAQTGAISTETTTGVLSPAQIAGLTTMTPNNKIMIGGVWSEGKWGVSLHEVHWGSTHDYLSYANGDYSGDSTVLATWVNKSLFTTNVEVRYNVTPGLMLALGANNAFDRYPSELPYALRSGGALYDGSSSQVGMDGGYYYFRVDYKF